MRIYDFWIPIGEGRDLVCRQRSRSLIQSDVLCKCYVDPESDQIISPYENPLYVLTQALPRFPLSAQFGGLSPITILPQFTYQCGHLEVVPPKKHFQTHQNIILS